MRQRAAVNKEGLTWEEWILATGFARVTWYGAESFRTYYTSYTPRPNPGPPGTVLLVFGTSRPPPPIPHKHTRTNYYYRLYDEWKAGVDPTELRAAKEKLENMLQREVEASDLWARWEKDASGTYRKRRSQPVHGTEDA